MLSMEKVRAYYDKFGSKQDSQAFYEDPATDQLLKHARFHEARAVFELGAGTGRFAEKLLNWYLDAEARYTGVDVSTTMVSLARQRLSPWSPRAEIHLSDGSAPLPAADGTIDRFVANYVFDLLEEQHRQTMLGEARRILRPEGLLCIVSLTHGTGVLTRMVSGGWELVYRLNAGLVGGCRPIELAGLVADGRWRVLEVTKISSFALTSQVLVAARTEG
jgi:ubiquinone/menaquinone biosynthesis C-methylase UbiE